MSSSHQHPRRPRLLLLAFACSPDRGSEAGVGWNRALQAARFCDTWVVCQGDAMGDEVRRYLAAHGPVPGLTFEFVRDTPLIRRMTSTPGLFYAGVHLWYRRAYRAAVRLHRDVGFDLAHTANLCTFREPGYLWKLGVPHVWGPWGGTGNFPWRFLGEAGPVGAVAEAARAVANKLQFRLGRRTRKVAAAGTILVTSTQAREQCTRVHGLPAEVVPCNGISRVVTAPQRWTATGRPLRVLWSGELRPIKALPLLLKAVAQMPPGVPCEVGVLGDGPSAAAWRRLARRLGVADRVTWAGWLPHAEALRQYAWADVFAFTSLRDNFPTVILEALAAGRPVVCLDHHGMRDIVTPPCGVKVPVTTPRRVVADLAAALAGLAADPARWEALSRGAVERAREFLWARLGEQMADIYRRALEASPASDEAAPAEAAAGDIDSWEAVSRPRWAGVTEVQAS